MNTLETIRNRHSYRGKYLPTPVPREDLIGSGPKCLIRAIPPRQGKPLAPPPKLPAKLPPKGKKVYEKPGFKPKPPKAEIKGKNSGSKSKGGRK